MALHERHQASGFEVLAFPCNQFGAQEPGTPEEILEFVSKYNVKFPMFEKVDVNGPNTHPLFNFMKSEQKEPGMAAFLGNDIKVGASNARLACGCRVASCSAAGTSIYLTHTDLLPHLPASSRAVRAVEFCQVPHLSRWRGTGALPAHHVTGGHRSRYNPAAECASQDWQGFAGGVKG